MFATSRNSKIAVFGLATILVLTSSCSKGGSSGGAPELSEAVATTLRPTPDGYSFANFSATGSPEEFGSADLVAMFGEGACVDGVVNPCDPIAEAAAWARMVNQARASGHCEGLVVEASKRFNTAASPQTVDLKNEGEVTHRIFQTFATQFLKETQDETASWQQKSLREIVNELGVSFQTGVLKYSMGLYTDTGGHALLPYAIDFTDPDHAVVHLYDSNWPGKDRYVEVDLKEETWKFSFSGSDPANDPKAWTGGAGDMDLTSLDARSNSLCPFCVTETKVKNSMLVIKSTDTKWSITTDQGTYSPSNETLVTGISSRPIKGSAGTIEIGSQAFEFVVFVEGTDMKLKFPSPTSAFVSQGTAVVQLLSSESSSAEVTVSGDSISVNDPNMTVTVASENLVASVAGNNTVVDIGAAQLNIATESASGQILNVVADAQTPQIVAKAVVPDGSSGGAQFVYTSKSADDVTQVHEVSSKGVETVKVVEETLDLNAVTAELPPVLAVVIVKEGLPPPEERDLSNPAYVADPVFVPTSGVVASRIEGSRVCDVPGYPSDWIIQANAISCTAPVLQLASASAQSRNTVGSYCSVGGVDGIWTAFGGSGTTICSPRIALAASRVTAQNAIGQPCSEYGIVGTWTSVSGIVVCQNNTVRNAAFDNSPSTTSPPATVLATTTTAPSTTTTVPRTTTTTTSPVSVPYFNAVQNLTASASGDGSVFLSWSAPQASNSEIYGYSIEFVDLDGGAERGGWGVWTTASNTSYSLGHWMFDGNNPVTTGYGPVRFKVYAMSGQCVGVGSGSCLYGPKTSADAVVLNPGTSTATTTTTTSTTTTTTTTTVPSNTTTTTTTTTPSNTTTTTTVVPFFNAVQNLTATAAADGSVYLSWGEPLASTGIYGYAIEFVDFDNNVESGGWGIWTYAANTSFTLGHWMFDGNNPVTTGYGQVRFRVYAMSGECVGVGSGSCVYGPRSSADAVVLAPS